jgi:hypothetical protein
VVVARLLALLAAASILAITSAGAASGYPWPLRPFDKQHPIRGFFGDPRTVYEDGVRFGFERSGHFSFHQGVDISAPDGTPVYPVVSGSVFYRGFAALKVKSANGRLIFQYVHVLPVVEAGQQVVAQQTVLGYVEAPFGHVHLTEIDDGRAVNPLQKGHLSPYVDRTRPTVRNLLFKDRTGLLITVVHLCGRLEIAADAFDTPPLSVPGSFHGFPVAPALVRWNISDRRGVVVPWHTAADFRRRLPPNHRFFNVYELGTFENAPRFGQRQHTSLHGRYLFMLARRFDTASLPNGEYTLTVAVADESSNRTVFRERFSILNVAGVCRGSLPALPGALQDRSHRDVSDPGRSNKAVPGQRRPATTYPQASLGDRSSTSATGRSAVAAAVVAIAPRDRRRSARP